MRRLTDKDTHWGKYITFGRTTRDHQRLVLTSHYDEDYPSEHYNAIVGALFGWAFRILLPQFIKPEEVKVYAREWSPAAIARMGRNFYFVYFDKEYGFSCYDNFFQLMYGVQGEGDVHFPKTLKEKRWSCFLPWSSYRHVKHQMFDGNERLVWEEDMSKSPTAEAHNMKRYDLQQQMYRQSYLVRDTDGEEIEVLVHAEFREWKRGESWCKWLSWFMDGIQKKTIELNFQSEIGCKKGSWKGGLMGMGYEMLMSETIDQTVERFFREKSVNDRDLQGVVLLRRLA